MRILRPFGQDIWTIDGDTVRMFGLLPFTTRMTIIRLSSGSLWIHSPVAPNAERRDAVEGLGPVAHLVAPNKIHSLGIAPWKALFPSARVWASPGFAARHRDIGTDEVLANDAEPAWRTDICHCVVAGHAILDEVVFLHKASRTLIVTDLIQKHEAAGETVFWRGVKRMGGILGEDGGVPLDIRFSVRDRTAFRRSIERILDWEFDNLILSHGHCLRGGAKEDVRRAFAWL